MIKDIMNRNADAAAGQKELELLKKYFPQCFHAGGEFDIEAFKAALPGGITITDETSGFNWLGKNYARMLTNMDTTTLIRPDEEHNAKPENKDSQNVYISGDNLDALQHLVKSYSGKVKVIYIDPPYNTGSDGFVYNDKFNFTAEDLAKRLDVSPERAERILSMTRRGSASHAAWLTFMLPRLSFARDLLTDDGVIFISIDDNEQANLKRLCDEVFGEENLIAQIIVQSNPRGRQSDTFVATVNDYLLCYAKNKDQASVKGKELTEKQKAEYCYDDGDGKKYRLLGLRQRESASLRTDRPDMYFPIYVNSNTKEISLSEKEGWEVVVPQKSDGRDGRWMWGKEKCNKEIYRLVPRFVKKRQEYDIDIKDYLERDNGERNTKRKTIWMDKEINNQNGTTELKALLGGEYADYPKPSKYINMILSFADAQDCIVLDFFGGSATTADSVMQHCSSERNCSFVLVQLPFNLKDRLENCDASKKKTIENTINWLESLGYPTTYDYVGFERIKRAAKKIKEDNPLFAGDLGFKHYTLEEPKEDALLLMEKFDPISNNITTLNVDDFGIETVLRTWLVADGYGLTEDAEEVMLGNYKVYWKGDHLYMINPDHDFNESSIAALMDKYNGEPFSPHNIVIFGYSFGFTHREELQKNLRTLKEGNKTLTVNIDVRY